MISSSARWEDDEGDGLEDEGLGDEGGEIGWRNKLTSPNMVEASLWARRNPEESVVGDGAEEERR